MAPHVSSLCSFTLLARGHNSPTHLHVSPLPIRHDEVSVVLTMLNILQDYGYLAHPCSPSTKTELSTELAFKLAFI